MNPAKWGYKLTGMWEIRNRFIEINFSRDRSGGDQNLPIMLRSRRRIAWPTEETHPVSLGFYVDDFCLVWTNQSTDAINYSFCRRIFVYFQHSILTKVSYIGSCNRQVIEKYVAYVRDTVAYNDVPCSARLREILGCTAHLHPLSSMLWVIYIGTGCMPEFSRDRRVFFFYSIASIAFYKVTVWIFNNFVKISFGRSNALNDDRDALRRGEHPTIRLFCHYYYIARPQQSGRAIVESPHALVHLLEKYQKSRQLFGNYKI